MSELLEMARKWIEEIDKLNAETDKRLEEFLKKNKESKIWRQKNE